MPADTKSNGGQRGGLEYIAEPLRGLAVPIDSLTPDAANARKHGERNMEAIVASLNRFGQRTPIVVQRKGMIVRAGNGRVQAAKSLGWTHIAAVVVDDESVDAVAYAIADNRTAELAEWDAETLATLLDTLPEEARGVTGFTGDDLQNLLASLTPPTPTGKPEDEWVDMPEYEHEDLTPHRSIIVHFANEENAQDFARLLGQKITPKTKYLWHPYLEETKYADKVYKSES